MTNPSLFTGHETVRALASQLSGPLVWAEVGVCTGEGLVWTIGHLLERGILLRQVYAIDPWGPEADDLARRYGQLGPHERAIDAFRDRWNTAGFSRVPLEKLVMSDDELLNSLRCPKHLDVVWLDGNHSYEATTFSVKQWARRATRAVVVDDYDEHSHPDVCRAVDEFLARSRHDSSKIGRQMIVWA